MCPLEHYALTLNLMHKIFNCYIIYIQIKCVMEKGTGAFDEEPMIPLEGDGGD